jgi:hypothetical protein
VAGISPGLVEKLQNMRAIVQLWAEVVQDGCIFLFAMFLLEGSSAPHPDVASELFGAE